MLGQPLLQGGEPARSWQPGTSVGPKRMRWGHRWTPPWAAGQSRGAAGVQGARAGALRPRHRLHAPDQTAAAGARQPRSFGARARKATGSSPREGLAAALLLGPSGGAAVGRASAVCRGFGRADTWPQD